jgi:hypothetical protein
VRVFNPLDHPICFAYPHRLVPSFAWVELAPFGMFLVDVLRPRVIVELGTHQGISYCAFCQAVRELQLDTVCYAVDAWQGDPQTGFFGDEVLADLRQHHDPLYRGFSTLLRSTFDGALPLFEAASVDMLHIDGLHTYEAVKSDFECWLPKMSSRGVVLLHDTEVRERDFGVWRLWDELRQTYPHFAVLHGCGLGLLAVGPKQPDLMGRLLKASGDEVARVRQFFSVLGARLASQQEVLRLKRQLTDPKRLWVQPQVQVRGGKFGDLRSHVGKLLGKFFTLGRAPRARP